MNLRIPGPTPLPPQVAAALRRPMMNHRGPGFADLQTSVVARLQQVLETKNDIVIYPSSGTGGMEAALANILSAGDRVLVCSAGMFGERFATMAAAFGARVEKLTAPMGAGIEPDALKEKLLAMPDVRAVLLTHSETSSGVLHPLQALARAVHDNSSALVVVDAISSVGAARLATDAWGCDVVITGSQKALMCPPGAAIVTISERAWAAYESARSPRYYWDWREWKKSMAHGQTPVTPPLPIYYALDAALDLMHSEGMNAIYARHERLADMLRRGARMFGYETAADSRYASPTVTTLRPPAGVEADTLLKCTRDELGVEFAGGLGEWKGKIVRVGHLGYVHEPDIQQSLSALQQALAFSVRPQASRPSEPSTI